MTRTLARRVSRHARTLDRLGWLVLILAVAYVLAHVVLDLFVTVERFEDGSATITTPVLVITVPAYDSPNDTIQIR